MKAIILALALIVSYTANSRVTERGGCLVNLGTGNIYYVDANDGRNTNDGLSTATPFKTLSKVLSVVKHGETILLKCGSTFRESLILDTLGNITVKSYGSGQWPIITGAEVVTGFTLVTGSVYKVDVQVEAATGNRGYSGIWGNNKRLKEYVIGDSSTTNLSNMIELLQNNVGSFYFTGVYASGWPAGTHSYYINVGSNPNTNNNIYQANKRNYVVRHNGATIQGLQLEKCQHHDGVLVGNYIGGAIIDCLLKDFGRHGCIDPTSNFTGDTSMLGNPKYPGGCFHPYSGFVGKLPYNPVYKNCTAIGVEGTCSGWYTHGGGGYPTHEKFTLENFIFKGLADGIGSCDIDSLIINNCKTSYCETDMASNAYVFTQLNNCEFIGAGKTSILLPRVNSTTQLNDVKIASSLNITTGAPFFGGLASGNLELNNIEFINQGNNPIGSVLPFIFGYSTIQSITIRNSVMFTINGYFNGLIRAKSVGSYNITDDNLIIGGIPSNIIINDTVIDLTTTSVAGIGRIQRLNPAKFYVNPPLINGFTKNAGVNYPIKSGYNAVVSELNSLPRGIIYYGKKIEVDLSMLNNPIPVFSPTSEMLGGYFSYNTPNGNGVHIGVGKNGLILRSTDLNNWSVITSSVTEHLNSGCSAGNFALGKDYDLIVGNNGTILKSTDAGFTFTTKASGTTNNLKSVATATISGKKVAVAVAEGGKIISSIDGGETWANRTINASGNLNKVIFANGLFVVVGAPAYPYYPPNILTSSDGINFYTTNVPSFKTAYSIFYNNGKFIATLGEDNNSMESLVTSTDGINWSALPVLIPFEITDITYINNQLGWILSGRTNAGQALSVDGANLVIPVTYTNFTATKQGSSVSLNWQTATEINNAYFTVQHSINGTSWVNIGTVNAGNGNYSFVHTTPATGTNYYRLQQVDKDGKSSVSEIRSVNFSSSNGKLSIYPNPTVGSNMVIDVAKDINKPISYSMYNALGVLVQQGTISQRQQTITIGRLSNGLYLLRLSDGQTASFIKQ
jgi:hypothetical protein